MRMKNLAPNQQFLKLDDVEQYYAGMDFALLENEIILDSILKLDDILTKMHW